MGEGWVLKSCERGIAVIYCLIGVLFLRVFFLPIILFFIEFLG